MSAPQQINLHQQQVRGGAARLSPSFMLVAMAAAAVAMLVITVMAARTVERAEAQLAQLEGWQAVQAESLGALSSGDAAPFDCAASEARQRATRAQIAAQYAAVKSVASGAVGSVDGFSDRLLALARRPVGGLWLEQIVLSSEPQSARFRGIAESPELVPQFIQRLQQEASLTGQRFDVVQIHSAKDGAYRFELADAALVPADAAEESNL